MKINIACLQMASRPYDRDYNIEKATTLIREAAKNGANICLLPEAFIPGYSLTKANFKFAETLDGPTISTLIELAKALNVHISGSIIEKTKTDFYNTMFILGPKGLYSPQYRKMYVASIENLFWKRGKHATIVETELGAIGFGICNDMHYPQLWRQYAGKVDLILISSAWPERIGGLEIKWVIHEDQLLKELPVKISKILQVSTAYCNACQTCVGKLPFNLESPKCGGHSKIIDKGKIIAAINSREECIIQGTIETLEPRPLISSSAFKNWIKYPLFEKIPRFFIETLAPYYCGFVYRWYKKRYRV